MENAPKRSNSRGEHGVSDGTNKGFHCHIQVELIEANRSGAVMAAPLRSSAHL